MFLPLGEAQKLLNLSSRSQMQNLFPFIPHVYFARRQTRFFPTSYLKGFAEFLDGRSATLRLVHEFNATDNALPLHHEAQNVLAMEIDSRSEHTPMQVADMFSAGRATVSGWVQAKVLPIEEKKIQGGRIVPMGPRQRRVMGRQCIRAQTLHDLFQWVSPF
jgi:hypothetical protein